MKPSETRGVGCAQSEFCVASALENTISDHGEEECGLTQEEIPLSTQLTTYLLLRH